MRQIVRSIGALVVFGVLLGNQAHGQVVIDIDVKPGSDANVINYKSQGKIPVALLCNAVSNPANIQQATISLCATSATIPCLPNAQDCDFRDVNHDGCADLVCHVPISSLQLQCGETSLTLTAVWKAGAHLSAADTVTVVPCP